MADVQLKHGHTRIADTLLEALMRTPLPALHHRVVLAIMRKTYGYQKTSDRMSSSQVAEMVGSDPSNVRRCLRDLTEWGVITRVGGGSGRGDSPMIHLVKNYEKWKVGDTEDTRRQRVHRGKRVVVTPLLKGGDVTPLTDQKRGDIGPKAGSGHPEKAGSGHPTQERRETRDKNRDNGKPKPKRKTQPPTAADFWLADYFIEKLTARHPGAKIHRTAWARSIGGIRATRGEKVESIDWLFGTKNSTRDYPYVVHSGTSLAEKWSRIRETMGKGNKPRSPQKPPAPSTQETPTPATPEQIAELRAKEISNLEAMVQGGTAQPFHVNRLRTLKAGGAT